jgi:hypothetical protein
MISNEYKKDNIGLFKADVIGIIKDLLKKLNKYN